MSPWLLERGDPYRAKVRVVAIPYAGAGASAFLPWAPLLPPEVSLAIVRLPGRENRFSEPRLTDMADVVAQLAPVVCTETRLPTVVFGYSLGALVGYELALRMQRVGLPPRLLAVGGAEAPHVPRTRAPMSRLPDAEFVEAVRQLNGTPPEVFAHPELLSLVLPTLRADFALLDGYTAAPSRLLTCPIVTYSGTADPELTESGVARWGELTDNRVSHRSFPGAHFFFSDDPQHLVNALLNDIELA